MILYLVKSTICLGLFLVIYHLFLEKEKMHRFNRAYLILCLVFSFTVPLLPVGGAADHVLLWISGDPSEHAASSSMIPLTAPGTETSGAEEPGRLSPAGFLTKTALLLWPLTSLLLFIQFMFKLDCLHFKMRRNARSFYKKATIILLKEKTIPFSFHNYIFLNEQDYFDGTIKNEVLIHEYAHVAQKHTYDILFIEFLKIIFWFNPLLFSCKKSMQLNHEFLADDAVINRTSGVASYQLLLLRTIQSQPPLFLTSSFSFPNTKKRMLMMTHRTSRTRSAVKQFSVLPLFFAAALIFGSLAAAQDAAEPDRLITIEIGESEVIRLNDKEIHYSFLERQLEGLSEDPGQIISLKVTKSAYTGIVLDVQRVIRNSSLLNINYSVIMENEDTLEDLAKAELESVVRAYSQVASSYMKLAVEEHPLEELQDMYDDIMRRYEAIDSKQQEIYRNRLSQMPPLPPVPPNPQWRMNNE